MLLRDLSKVASFVQAGSQLALTHSLTHFSSPKRDPHFQRGPCSRACATCLFFYSGPDSLSAGMVAGDGTWNFTGQEQGEVLVESYSVSCSRIFTQSAFNRTNIDNGT
jgi:hypothetical protein